MFYLDYYYLVLVLPAMIFAMWASSRVNSTFKKYSNVFSRRGITGREAAEAVLRQSGVNGIRIERVSGNLTDHYDPKARVIRLSDQVYNSSSAAAIGVAAHEAGHAVQHSESYTPLTLRNSIIPITNIGSRLSIPLIIIGLFLTYYGKQFLVVAYIGVALFSFATLFQLLTLPTEYNASRRALAAIEQGGLLDGDELGAAKKVLSAAALTYVAALAVSVAQLLRLLMLVNRRRD